MPHPNTITTNHPQEELIKAPDKRLNGNITTQLRFEVDFPAHHLPHQHGTQQLRRKKIPHRTSTPSWISNNPHTIPVQPYTRATERALFQPKSHQPKYLTHRQMRISNHKSDRNNQSMQSNNTNTTKWQPVYPICFARKNRCQNG